MAIYSTGSVSINVGSSTVTGNGTLFNTYAAVGNLFKITSEPTFYDIAAVNSDTSLTLSARYANTNYHSVHATEPLATTNNATRIYSGTLDNTPVILSRLTINASGEKFTESGGGALTATSGGSGTIAYDSGSWDIILNATFVGSNVITASYDSGMTRSALPYQIVRDYTSRYNINEISPNDANFQFLVTKGFRTIDSAIYGVSDSKASLLNKTASYDVVATDFGKVIRFNSTATLFARMPVMTATDDGARIGFSKQGVGKFGIRAGASQKVMDSAASGVLFNVTASEIWAFVNLQYLHGNTTFIIESGSGTFTAS